MRTNKILSTGLFLLFAVAALAQQMTVGSPNQKLKVELSQSENSAFSAWFLKVDYRADEDFTPIIPKIDLGLLRNDQDFSKALSLKKVESIQLITEEYTALHGKRLQRKNTANEITFCFENENKSKLNVVVRAWNDGVTFRYEFPEKEGDFVIQDELTAYSIPNKTKRWLEEFDLSNERLYANSDSASVQQNWSYPALFESPETACWYLIHEADVDRNYCATKLSNYHVAEQYKVTLPHPGEGEGEALPQITLPWKSPWRVIVIGSLADVVESTLVDDVSKPSVLENTDWVKPGVASWNYWSHNHGTKDFKTVCEFADLAAEMNWPYTLLDWEWDQMENGGNLEDALEYIHSLGVKPLMWYNSGMFKWITSTPVDRMKTHENRMEEFAKLKELGVYGVKIDFFLSEKQYMIDYYLDILEDAAQFNIMVYFHGCLVPRGWQRTYPHLMTYEGVRGAEWYNNGPELTAAAPEHNNVLPYTRNVVGSMDYTPVTFTNSQYPHITSYAHELALSVVFESGIQHFADRPEGFQNLPDAARTFLKEVPVAWDETKLLDGYPGKFTVIARKKAENWYVGGINSDGRRERHQSLDFDFLPNGKKFRLTLIADGEYDTVFSTQYMVVDHTSSINIKMLRRGGFAAVLKPIND